MNFQWGYGGVLWAKLPATGDHGVLGGVATTKAYFYAYFGQKQ